MIIKFSVGRAASKNKDKATGLGKQFYYAGFCNITFASRYALDFFIRA